MKAWKVYDESYIFCTIIFAETRNKAKAEALHTDCCEGMEYKDIRPRRFPEADCMYKGKREMDWECEDDRIFLVKHGITCEYVDDNCKNCCAKNYCYVYAEWQNEFKEEQ